MDSKVAEMPGPHWIKDTDWLAFLCVSNFREKNTVIWKFSWAEEFHKLTVESSVLQATVVIKI